jgi:hypothetical protein
MQSATAKKGSPRKILMAVAVKDSPAWAAPFLRRTPARAKVTAAKTMKIKPFSIRAPKLIKVTRVKSC